MLTVRPLEPFASQFFGGAAQLEFAAGNLFAVVSELDRIAPGFAEVAELRVAFAVDGVAWQDWSAPLPAEAEVMLFPRVAGGNADHELEWRPLSPFGAEIVADLSLPLSPRQQEQIRTLFDRHSLLLARGQSLTKECQQELCGLIGPVLERDGEDGTMSNEGGGPSASALAWHADAAYTKHPFEALSLHAIDVVAQASSTRFVDTTAALGRLDPGLRAQLGASEQQMISPHYTMIAERTCERKSPDGMVGGIMPTIKLHPRSDRSCLWVSELQTAQLLGMDWQDSRDILRAVYDELYAPEAIFEHRWSNGDFILWDNIALQHARGDLRDVGKRVLQRAIVGTQGAAPHVALAKLRDA